MASPEPSEWRERIPGRRPEENFHWRGKEVSRIENLADAVFGFALTLLIVSNEVPRDFGALIEVVRGFPTFVACSAILIIFWNAHYRFFRRYGLEDMFTRVVNYGILLIILFAVYPLKFLFSAWFAAFFGGERVSQIGTWENLRWVFRLYGAGMAYVWLLFMLLYWHAYKLRDHLGLTEAERLLTRADLTGFALCVGICCLSIACTFLPFLPFLPGFIYCLIGVALSFNYRWHGQRVTAALAQAAPATPAPNLPI